MHMFEEILWPQFVKLDGIRQLPLNEQIQRYNVYLEELETVKRAYETPYQVKGAAPSFSPSPSPVPPSPTPSVTITPSITPSVTVTPSITPTPSITVTPSVTPTPSVTITPSITPTVTITPSVTVTPSITPTPSSSPTYYLQQEDLNYVLQEDNSKIIIT